MRCASLSVCSVLVLGFAMTAITAFGQGAARQIVTGSNTTLPFSAAVKADGLIYVAGAIGNVAGVSGDITQQTKQTLDGIAETLKAAGSPLGTLPA
jgi:enamine deaminase RidA (YjgF/YER057c/UK114 family)